MKMEAAGFFEMSTYCYRLHITYQKTAIIINTHVSAALFHRQSYIATITW